MQIINGMATGALLYLALLVWIHHDFDKDEESVASNHDRIQGNYWKYFLIRPNTICFWRVLLGLPGLWLFCQGFYFPGSLLFVFASLGDTLDGMVARLCGLTSKVGELIDPVADKIIDNAAFYVFAFFYPIITLGYVALLVFLEVFVNMIFVRWYANLFGGSLAAKVYGKRKRLFYNLFFIYLGIGVEIPYVVSQEIIGVCMIFCITLSLLSSFDKIPEKAKLRLAAWIHTFYI